MTDATQPRLVRGTTLIAAIAAAALCALMAFAPFATAAPDPVASGSTTITLNQGFLKSLKKKGVTVLQAAPAKLKGNKATLPVTGGELDPLTGLGTVNLGGGFKFKGGKKSVTVSALVLNTGKKTLSAKIGGKKTKLAKVSGYSYVRSGFGVNLAVKQLKLDGKAASSLNKTLAAKAKQKPFTGNKLIGSASSETQPKTVTLLPGGSAELALSASALEKLGKVGPTIPTQNGPVTPFAVKLDTIAPTSIVSAGPPPTVSFPVGGGTMGPAGTAGVLQTAGGLSLTQNLDAGDFLIPPGQLNPESGQTTLKLGNVFVDLGTKQASVEVTIENPKTAKANLGNLGRVSIADVNLTAATVSIDPATRKVSVQNAVATLQGVTAETLNTVFIKGLEETIELEKDVKFKDDVKFLAGDPLGTFSFTAQMQ